MKMRSPIVAILWELWRATRVEAAWRLALGIVGALAALALFAAIAPPDDPKKYEAVKGFGAAISMIFLVLPHFLGWVSLSRFTGGRIGFPFYLLYTRPVRTAVIVGLPLAYLTAVPSAIYLLSALLLKAISGYPFPLLPVAAWIAALNAASLATHWPTRKLTVMLLPGMVVGSAWTLFALHRLTSFPDGFDWYDSPKLWPSIFDLPLTDYVLIALIGLASFSVAVAGVARQRRGDGGAVSWTPGNGWPERLVSLFRFPCPTSSATRAQVWFELKSSGLPLLAIAVALAIVIPLSFAVSGPLDAAVFGELLVARPMALMFAGFSLLSVLVLGGNVFAIRGQHGRLSTFEATQAYETSSLVGLKVLVRSVCKLAAFIVVGVSVWTSLSSFPILKDDKLLIQIAGLPLSDWMRGAEAHVAALTGYEQLALAVVATIWMFAWVAAFAALRALWTRYFRRVNIAASLLLLYGFVLALLPVAERSGIASALLVDTLFVATRWIAAAAVILTTLYFVWSGFAERVLTAPYAGLALVISAAFWAAWATVLQTAGVNLAEIPAANAVSILSLLLLPLMASVLAPWAFNRIRHF